MAACDLMVSHYAQCVAASQGETHSAAKYLFTMNDPAERLKQARIAAGYESAPAAAAAMGVPDPTYMSHENGSRGFSRSAERYARFFRTTPEWLLFGTTGAARQGRESAVRFEPTTPGAQVDPLELRSFISRQPSTKPKMSALRLRPIARQVPVVGEVAAGIWRETVVRELSDVEEYLPVDVTGYERADLRAMKVVGPSMDLVYPPGRYVVIAHPAEAGVRIGDYVVVQRQKADVFEITLKEFAREKGRIVLLPRSSHPDHQSPIYLDDNGEHDQTAPLIIGVVVADYSKRDRPPMTFEDGEDWRP